MKMFLIPGQLAPAYLVYETLIIRLCGVYLKTIGPKNYRETNFCRIQSRYHLKHIYRFIGWMECIRIYAYQDSDTWTTLPFVV